MGGRRRATACPPLAGVARASGGAPDGAPWRRRRGALLRRRCRAAVLSAASAIASPRSLPRCELARTRRREAARSGWALAARSSARSERDGQAEEGQSAAEEGEAQGVDRLQLPLLRRRRHVQREARPRAQAWHDHVQRLPGEVHEGNHAARRGDRRLQRVDRHVRRAARRALRIAMHHRVHRVWLPRNSPGAAAYAARCRRAHRRVPPPTPAPTHSGRRR